MKKFYSLVFALVAVIGFTNAQCTVNASAQTTPGVNPTAANLPCIEQTVAYDQTVQGKIQGSGDTTITVATFSVSAHIVVDSVVLDSITGAPAGIATTWAPAVIYADGNGCVKFAGTTTAAVGNYPLTAWGTAYLHIQATVPFVGNIDTPYVKSGNLNRYSPFGDYSLTVVAQGAPCVHTSGINDFNADLNSALSVFPNPNNGQFTVNINAGHRVNGEMVIVDVTGRTVYSQKLDLVGLYNTTVELTKYAKGLYTVQLRTAEGVASKKISIE